MINKVHFILIKRVDWMRWKNHEKEKTEWHGKNHEKKGSKQLLKV